MSTKAKEMTIRTTIPKEESASQACVNRHVNLFMETFPAASETWNWSVAKGLLARGYTVTTVASTEGDWSVIGGRTAFSGRALYPKVFSIPKVHPRLRHIAEVAASIGRVTRSDFQLSRRIQRTFPIAQVKGATAIWSHAFIRDEVPRRALSHGLFGLSARRATMLREVGIIDGPVVGTFGGFDINVVGRREGRGYYAEFFVSVDRIIAVSEFIRRRLIEFGASADKVEVVYYGVDLEKFAYREPPTVGDRLVFVALGRLVECKGVEYAIDAFAEVLKVIPSAQLKIIGDGPLESALKNQARRTLPDSSYRFLGMIPHAEVQVELRNSDVLLAPGVVGNDGAEEALGGSVIEAHAIGLPVICSDVGGLSEAIVPDVSGYLVPEKRVDALAEAMLKIAENRDKWPQMASHGRRHIENNFSAIGYLDRLERVYEKAWEHYESQAR